MATINPVVGDQHVTPPSPAALAAASPETISGDTFTAGREEIEEKHETQTAELPADPVDLESQTTPSPPNRRRSSALTLLRSLSTTLTGFSERIPPHWKANFINDARETRSLEDFPDGFPRFAAWMNCDENFLLARKYGWLHTRVLLFRQSELRELELELQRCDDEDAKEAQDALIDHYTFGSDESGEYRRELMGKIDEKLKEYDDIVMRAKTMFSLPKAGLRNYTSVCNRIYNTAPFAPREKETFMQDSDFVALAEREEALSFDGFVEDMLTVLPCRRLTRFLFSNAEQRATSSDKTLFLYDKRRIDTFIRIVMAFLAVALLLAPVVVLFLREQDSGTEKIVVILVFTLFFSLALSMATKAKRSEVFAATAAYCAVLVVFLGNFIPSTSSPGST